LPPRADRDARLDDEPRPIGGIILAAGESRRFGAQKLLADLGGRPLLQHVIEAAVMSALEDIVIVLGADADRIAAGIVPGRTRVVRNDDYASGLASSLQTGLRAIDPGSHAALVLLGDVPGVTTALISELLARGRVARSTAVVSVWRGQRSPPVLLHRILWPAAFALRGDVGMREVLAGRVDVAELNVSAKLGSLDDVDTRQDHERLARRA
jgi:molybdenum cofactor cytidylyltransferase